MPTTERQEPSQLLERDPIKVDLAQAFNEHRAFPFYPDRNIIDAIESGADPELFHEQFIGIKNVIFHAIAGGDATVEKRLREDARLSGRVSGAVEEIHRCVAAAPNEQLPNRRFVIVKETPGRAAFTRTPSGDPELSHIGLGPEWTEIPTIYLSLRLFDLAAHERQRGETGICRLIATLLESAETAIENGFDLTHSSDRPRDEAKTELLAKIRALIAERITEYEEAPVRPPARPVTPRVLETLVQGLDARLPKDALNFDHTACLRAIGGTERLARRHKRRGDAKSLTAVASLLVAASGHDLHEVRNRANIALERLYAPKEYDAPLATTFQTVRTGQTHRFEFELPQEKDGYLLRLYFNGGVEPIATEEEITKLDITLTPDDERREYYAEYTFRSAGFCDYVVLRRRGERTSWIDERGMSGRINVVPDVRGEIMLEIFPDIHGHTRVYWTAGDGHPGLVYNENGEVIRLGTFADVTAHLEDLKRRYQITAVYLLGVQKRGNNREDWAPEATSPSPFSPTSLTEIEPSLGGADAFRELVDRAHELSIRVVVDIMPHVNRASQSVPAEWSVLCYDDSGRLVERASTDGRYGSWNDGRLLNYRKLEVWNWLADSVAELIERFDIDGIRFDTAHAVPIMMKRSNFPGVHGTDRGHREMLEGRIIVNDREDDHFVTTGYYDSACRELIACPFYTFLMKRIEGTLRRLGKTYFVNIAECYWGRERFLARSGVMPYNSALFKICENIIHGKTDVREIYHLYDNHYAAVLPSGTQLVGILGNHDERRALNTFGHRGVRAAIALTSFMSGMILDYEGSAEGEAWKVQMDNIYVNWNQFEEASQRSLEPFYREIYTHHRRAPGDGYLLWAENPMLAAALKTTDDGFWIGAFNFSDENQTAAIHLDKPDLPIDEDAYYSIEDPVYSPVTRKQAYYSGRELRVTKVHTVVSYTDRIKLLRVTKLEEPEAHYHDLLRDSLMRSDQLDSTGKLHASFAYQETGRHLSDYGSLATFLSTQIFPLFNGNTEQLESPMRRIMYQHAARGTADPKEVLDCLNKLAKQQDEKVAGLAARLAAHNRPGPSVFIAAEADPFSKSGGLANVVYELPRELVARGEEVYVITPMYRMGSQKAQEKMRSAVERYGIHYTGTTVKFFIEGNEYEVGVHAGKVDGITYLLLDHYELFDGLYWGYTGAERLRRRVGLARSAVEAIVRLDIHPLFIFTNDAFAGVFNGIARADPYYAGHPSFVRTAFFHIIHNGGWQYFDAYDRWENGKDLFGLFNLPGHEYGNFSDPSHWDRLNCMACGIRYADAAFTVSPSYAHQLRVAGDGLERVITRIVGINNAIGADFSTRARSVMTESGFVESTYPALAEQIELRPGLRRSVEGRYPEILGGPKAVRAIRGKRRREIVLRMLTKLLLQAHYGLTVDPDCILATMIHRVTDQKGFNLLLEASEGIVQDLGVQLIAGGPVNWDDSGSSELAAGLETLGRIYPSNVSIHLGFQDVRIPLLGSDLFLMPSRHEPGGISQLEALACGCLVVARATGGLRDTVFPIHRDGTKLRGNGALFTDFTAHGFYGAVERLHRQWHQMDDEERHDARRNAESSVSYWDKPAHRYLQESYGYKEIIRTDL